MIVTWKVQSVTEFSLFHVQFLAFFIWAVQKSRLAVALGNCSDNLQKTYLSRSPMSLFSSYRFLLSLMIYNSIAKDAMYSVKFLTNLGNCLSPCLFWAPYALVPPPLWCCTGQHLRPLRPWLCLEKSPLQSQNIYCNRISGLTKASCNNRFIQCCTSSNPQPLSFPKCR